MASPLKLPAKDPDEVLDYGYDWSTHRIGDDVVIEANCDVVLVETSHADKTTGAMTVERIEIVDDLVRKDGTTIQAGQGMRFWLSGGQDGIVTTFDLFSGETTQGRQLNRRVKVPCETH